MSDIAIDTAETPAPEAESGPARPGIAPPPNGTPCVLTVVFKDTHITMELQTRCFQGFNPFNVPAVHAATLRQGGGAMVFSLNPEGTESVSFESESVASIWARVPQPKSAPTPMPQPKPRVRKRK